MVKITRKPEENLEIIKKLLAVLLLKSGVNVKQVAKISEMSDKTLTELYPKSKMKRSTNG
ncbi:MAG: hypothetical protein ACREAK_07585 [Nitrosarchaeum sp.]